VTVPNNLTFRKATMRNLLLIRNKRQLVEKKRKEKNEG
jgi:hypothetical protein